MVGFLNSSMTRLIGKKVRGNVHWRNPIICHHRALIGTTRTIPNIAVPRQYLIEALLSIRASSLPNMIGGDWYGRKVVEYPITCESIPIFNRAPCSTMRAARGINSAGAAFEVTRRHRQTELAISMA